MSSTIRTISSEDASNMETLRKLSGFGQKVVIDIKISNPRSTYTTLDRIEGAVSILAPVDTSFDEINVEFVGTSRTYVERLTAAAAVSGRSEAFHQFLKLQDRSIQDVYPEHRILKAGNAYEFPFVFVIPQQLLPKICGHPCKAAGVREAHLRPPPTFGDRDGEDPADAKALDDCAPEMASTRYGVHVRICKAKLVDGELTRSNIANKAKRVRVIPATEEQPPLDISADDKEYCMRKERVVRKGVLQGKAGTLVMEAIQPPSIHMRARSNSPAASNAKIMLRFDPADKHSLPPSLGSLATKLKVCTFFATTARSSFPSKKTALQDPSLGVHSDQLNLPTRCMAGVSSQWTAYESETDARRASSASSYPSSIPAASKHYKGQKFFVIQLDVPIALPTKKAFVPTFHSCLISRIYQVKFELALQSKVMAGTMDLKLPIQISCSEDGDWSPRRGSVAADGSEHGVSEEEVAAFFDPRTMHIPDDAFLGHSDIRRPSPPLIPRDELPPSYSFFAPAVGAQTVPAY